MSYRQLRIASVLQSFLAELKQTKIFYIFFQFSFGRKTNTSALSASISEEYLLNPFAGSSCSVYQATWSRIKHAETRKIIICSSSFYLELNLNTEKQAEGYFGLRSERNNYYSFKFYLVDYRKYLFKGKPKYK